MKILENDALRIELSGLGAEMRSLKTADGAEWLWQGDAAWWTGRSPLLFPVVGRSPKDSVSVDGESFPMKPHGFARTQEFAVQSETSEQVVFVLRPNEVTRASYPFEFALMLVYELNGPTLEITATVFNRGDRPMPAQFGFHPAFNWPLPGAAGSEHVVELEGTQPSGCYRLDADKLLLQTPQATPFVDGRLVPDAAMFEDDAMIFLDGVGTRMSFAGGLSRLDIVAKNLPQLGIWQKPGAPYLCVEPWQGTAPFAGTGDDLATRNGAIMLSPRASASFVMEITPKVAG